MDNRDIFAVATEIKIHYPNIPIVVLTPFSKEVSKRIANEDLSAIDYVFSWLGNAELLLAIIKLIEDKMNAPDDTASVGVQIILLVEDSVRFYSSSWRVPMRRLSASSTSTAIICWGSSRT